MKVLLFIPEIYSIAEMLKDGFTSNNCDVKIVDYQELIPHKVNRLYEKTAGLPNRFTKYWKPAYFNLINKKYIEYCKQEKPDIILIYNNQYFFPETIEKLKKHSKIVFFLGDNPLWSKTFDFNLTILNYADLILSPDSHWKNELTSMGISNVVVDFAGYSTKQFFAVDDIPNYIMQKYKCDILFIGRNYKDSSGYKRTLFYNSFSGLDFKIFGSREWEKWLPFFPDLLPHYNSIENRLTDEELNYALNCSKIYPVEQNTGIINGIHLRVFEAIGVGVLPIVEWAPDIDLIFGDLLPSAKNYSELNSLAKKYIANEEIRVSTVNSLKSILERKFTTEMYVARILERLSSKGK